MRSHLSPRRVAALVLAVAIAASASAGKRPAADEVWRAPGLDSLDLRSIALLPVVTFDGNMEAKRLTEDQVGRAFRASGHRWLSPATSRDMLVREGGDSLLKAIARQVEKRGQVDSADAAALSRLTHSRALLTVRVDRIERIVPEADQSGRPSTTVELTAALVDSTGALLWRARGVEVAEGTYQDSYQRSGVIGVKTSGLSTTPLTDGSGAPSVQETMMKMLARWTERFPRRAPAPAQ